MDTRIFLTFSLINNFFMWIMLVLSNKGQKYCTMTNVGYNGGVMDRVSYHELTLLLLLSSSVLWECDGLPASPKPPHHNTYCQLACAIANEAAASSPLHGRQQMSVFLREASAPSHRQRRQDGCRFLRNGHYLLSCARNYSTAHKTYPA